MKILVTIAATAGLMIAGVATASAKDAYCDQWAKDQARAETGGNIVGGAVVGGVGGAVLGGILGNKKNGKNKGLTTGAVAGALGGGALGAATRNRAYTQAYADCVANKASYQPAPVAPAYAPPVGSPQWVAACDAKYKTFNPATGYFIAKYDAAGNPVYRVCSLP